MPKSNQQIIQDIQGHIRKRGGDYGDWFVGVGSSARHSLFEDHRVREKGDCWILRRAGSAKAAREILSYFSTVLATDCQAGNGGEAADAVYAYRKAAHTKP